jgi:hypothetical protein
MNIVKIKRMMADLCQASHIVISWGKEAANDEV